MLISKKLLLTLIFIASSAQCANSWYELCSMSFLAQYSTVRKTLKKNGFTELHFKTPDQLRLNCLFLERPHAQYNVIICAGWLPGKMEGMADFFELLPDDCNILFFDSRGHAKSEGNLFKNIWRYGVNEYQDILGAITFINQNNQLPIFLIGICAGAFNAAHALITLEKQNLREKFNIKGLIFDSGWGSVTKMSYTNGLGNIEKVLIKYLGSLYETKALFKQSFFYKLLSTSMQSAYNILHRTCIKPLVAQYENTTNLFDKIHHIQQLPIFFVHAHNDNIAYIEDVKTLSTLICKKECWWLDYSSHAAHHIKHKDLYKEKLATFINTNLK